MGSQLNRIIGVTGTPGTGKKSVAPLLAKGLRVQCLSIDGVARAHGLLKSRGGEWEVDAAALRREFHGFSSPAVLYGHLLPHSIDERLVSRAVVLRCEPSVLKRRLAGRGYSQKKVIDNVESELIGVVSSETFEAFGEAKTFEIDTTDTAPEEAAGALKGVIDGDSKPGPRIDWTLAYDTGAKLRALLSVGSS